ncbi:MAG TPA: FAD-binding protein [Allosphingosinicella sp.]|nr:FAD-binding protein [Allosphingosinicella sp.]
MPAWPETPTLKFAATPVWDNWHKTVSQAIQGVYTPFPPAGTDSAKVIAGSVKDIQIAIKAAKERKTRLRAAGSAWSLSRAGVTDGVMLDTSRLKHWFRIKEGNLDPGYKGDADLRSGLFFFQCGILIAEVNKTVESDACQRSLWTSGAANGQTIVGATSTGTHGSALAFGALHDHIVAIHLLAGPDKQIMLERDSYRVLKPAFAAAIGADLVRNDALFDAAVMSFGAMGVIHGVVIETRKRFMLRGETHAPVAVDQDLRKLIATLDPETHPKLKGKGALNFLQVVINPHSKDAMINAMYEEGWKAGHVPDYELKEGKVGPGYDSLGLIGNVLNSFPGLIPPFFKLAQGTIDTKPKTLSRGEMFGYKAPQLKVGSGSVAVALPDALKTLDLLDAAIKAVPAPLVFGCRFVKRSPALLAFNRFPMTMVVSLDGIFNDQSVAFFAKAAAALEQNNIPYTQHWGKVNAYTKDRLTKAYGGNLDAWRAARAQLLPDPADRAVFTNPYMEERGLTG